MINDIQEEPGAKTSIAIATTLPCSSFYNHSCNTDDVTTHLPTWSGVLKWAC